MKKKITALLLTAALLSGLFTVNSLPLSADAVAGDYYLSLGADLTKEEEQAVFDELGLTEKEAFMGNYTTVSNEEEHQYLDSYISSKAIGKRALSSVYIEKMEEGHGIQIHTENITYCTDNMYKNALSTSGIKDVEVRIAGPYPISGTAALVGAMKAYEIMTGEEISEETKDAVNDELVTTKDLSESLGEEEATEFINTLKERAAEIDLQDAEDVEALINEVCQEQNIELTDDQKKQLSQLVEKFASLDIDMNTVMKQAQDIYSNLDEEIKSNGIFEQIKAFFQKIINIFTE